MTNMKLVALCGSIRTNSSNRSLLAAYASLGRPDMDFTAFEGLGYLPHFNPDSDGDSPPPEVAAFRALIAGADALVISTPEYVHALPGVLKNALEWLVSDPAFAGKPVAILHIARGTTWALDSLREVLRTMSAEIVEQACVSVTLGTNQTTPEALLARPDLRASLDLGLAGLRRHLARA